MTSPLPGTRPGVLKQTVSLFGAILLILVAAVLCAAAQQPPAPTRIAFRYDGAHVIVQLDQAGNAEFRGIEFSKLLKQLPLPDAHVSGISVVGTSDELMRNYLQLFGDSEPGQRWEVEVGSQIFHAAVETLAFSGTGCQTEINAVAILAIAPAEQAQFRALANDVFLAHPAGSRNPAISGAPALLGAASLSRAQQGELKAALNAAMQAQLAKVRQAAQAEYQRDPALRQKWTAADERLARGQGKLEFQAQRLRLGPQGQERLYVRAKWSLGDYAAFLLSGWADPQARLRLEAADSHPAVWLRTSEFKGSSADWESLGEILGVFAGEGGWARVVLGQRGYEGYTMVVWQYAPEGPKETEIAYGYGC